MLPELPELPGVRHADHPLPTGVRLHVAEAGDPDAPAILAVHGWPQHWWMWRGVIGPLARTHRVVCPDLRGFGWSGQPDDGDFVKDRLADDMIALLDVLGIERAGYLGHDWGGWTGWLVAIRAPERVSRLMTVAVPHPWPPRAATLLNAWRMAYQYPLAVSARRAGARLRDRPRRPRGPPAAPALHARRRRGALRRRPARAGWRARVELPVKILFPRSDFVQSTAQLGGLERHAPRAEVEVLDGGHFLVDERPDLVADRARAWFA